MKRSIRLILGIIYLAAICVSLLVLIKSGASFFYLKSAINPQALSQVGAAYDYPFKINTSFYDPKSVIVLEDQKMLEDSWPVQVTSKGNGVYALGDVGAGQVNVLLSPTGLSDPATAGHTYQVYIRPYFISSNLGGIYFLVLIVGLIAFLWPDLADPRRRKVLFGSPFGFVTFWVDRFDRPILDISNRVPPPLKDSAALWIQAAVNLVLVAYFYVLMEWIFLITKPSFMDVFQLDEKLKILMTSGFAIALCALLSLAIFFLIDWMISPFIPAFRRYARHVPFALLSSCLCLILIDNFTYTVFKFGVVDSTFMIRALYALGFIAIFGYVLQKAAKSEKHAGSKSLNRIYIVAATGLMGASLILAGFIFQTGNRPNGQPGQTITASKKPNIIFMSSDGVNAKNMSVYGYERDTTPFMTELAKTSLISENNFTNAAHTMGSTNSILTGKLPLTTHLFTPPDILIGADEYEHLPAILKINGYYTVQLGTPEYMDANAANFQDAFDTINCEDNSGGKLTNFGSSYGFTTEFYMLALITGRINDRVSQIFFLKDMVNPLARVTISELDYLDDQKKIDCLFTYLKNANQAGQPLFAQMHLMVTHGENFYPSSRIFSKGESRTGIWMTDFYDDTILDWDADVKNVVQFLKDQGLYDNTILVLYSDHGEKWVTSNRIPLIIHFPGDQHAGVLTENTQIIDVPLTMLDYMGIQKPSWMEGVSLLENFDPYRLIIGTNTDENEVKSGTNVPVEAPIKPSPYKFTYLTVEQCQNLVYINFNGLSIQKTQVDNYVNPCPPGELDSEQVIHQKIGKLLTQLGYVLPADW